MFRILPFILFFIACGQNQELSFIDRSPSFAYPIQAIAVENDSVAYFTGGDIWSKGFIGKSSNCGETWQVDSVCNKMLFAMDIHQGKGSASGIDGRYFELEGDAWIEKPNGQSNIIKGIDQSDNKTLLVGGHAYQKGVIYSIDSDGSAKELYNGPSELSAIQIVDNDLIYAVGFGTVLRSQDGGHNWTLLDIDGDFFKDIYMFDSSLGYLIGYAGAIYKTSDGGSTWDAQRGAGFVAGLDGLNACAFLDRDNGFVVGKNGLVLRTTNGGQNWEDFTLKNQPDLLDIAIWNDRIFVVGDHGSILELQL